MRARESSPPVSPCASPAGRANTARSIGGEHSDEQSGKPGVLMARARVDEQSGARRKVCPSMSSPSELARADKRRLRGCKSNSMVDGLARSERRSEMRLGDRQKARGPHSDLSMPAVTPAGGAFGSSPRSGAPTNSRQYAPPMFRAGRDCAPPMFRAAPDIRATELRAARDMPREGVAFSLVSFPPLDFRRARQFRVARPADFFGRRRSGGRRGVMRLSVAAIRGARIHAVWMICPEIAQ